MVHGQKKVENHCKVKNSAFGHNKMFGKVLPPQKQQNRFFGDTADCLSEQHMLP